MIDANGRIYFKTPNPPQKAVGMAALIQIVLFALFTDPGRNTMYPDRGGGIGSMIGSNVSEENQSELFGEVAERVDKIKGEIVETQNSMASLPADEKLRDIQVLNVESGTNIDEIVVKLRLTSEAGEEFKLIV